MFFSTISAASFVPKPVLAVSMSAEPVFGPVTNSIIFTVIVAGLIVWFVRSGMKDAKMIPDGKQNFIELVAEFLYGQVESLVGKKVAPRAFPLLATLFVFILVANWSGLFPGVGTIGWGHGEGFFSLHEVEKPLLRPMGADLNATLAMTLVVFAFWIYFTVTEVGVVGFLKHTFAPKGGLTGFMGIVMAVIFFAVGLIEVFSILLRNLTLPMRLYGNVFAGENVLHTMSGMLDGLGGIPAFIGKVVLPLPFYFMELLVGLLQALVFSLLTAVYIKLSTEHSDEDHGHGHEEAHH